MLRSGGTTQNQNPENIEDTERFQRDLDPLLSDYIVSFAFGDIYSRNSLSQQEQAMVTISSLAALGTGRQLKLHINVGFNVGLTREKIMGTLIHLLPYVGFPRVLNVLTLVKEVMAERGASGQPMKPHMSMAALTITPRKTVM